MAARGSRESQGTSPQGAGTSPKDTGARPTSPRSRLGWIAVAVAGLLLAWQVIFAITAPSMTNPDVYESVDLLLTLVLAVGAVVLGIVALGQRVTPRWPAVAALAIGTFAFVVAVASWVGRLMY